MSASYPFAPLLELRPLKIPKSSPWKQYGSKNAANCKYPGLKGGISMPWTQSPIFTLWGEKRLHRVVKGLDIFLNLKGQAFDIEEIEVDSCRGCRPGQGQCGKAGHTETSPAAEGLSSSWWLWLRNCLGTSYSAVACWTWRKLPARCPLQRPPSPLISWQPGFHPHPLPDSGPASRSR